MSGTMMTLISSLRPSLLVSFLIVSSNHSCLGFSSPPSFQRYRSVVSSRIKDASVCLKLASSSSAVSSSADKEEEEEDVVDEENLTQFRKRNKRWLVLVDDEESIRMAVGDFLYDQGYRVTACADATALVEVVSTPPPNHPLPRVPDVIISDIRMPGRDGLELLHYIRTNKRLERVAVVLLTAKGFTKDRIEGYQAGADAYLTKPFDPDELLAIVDNLILRRQQMAGAQGRLVELQQEMANIKQVLKLNAAKVVQKTNVYLTPTERHVLTMMSDGMTNAEMAQERKVTPESIGGALGKIYLKTDTRSRTELVRWAIKTGYIPRRRMQ